MLQSSQTVLTTVTPDPAAPWWQTTLDVAVGLSTVAVAFFAVVELLRARQERRDRKAAADARVSAVAFALRRQLLSWLAAPRADYCQYWAEETTPHFPPAEERFRSLMAEVDASPPIQEALREAFARFYRATGLLNDVKEGRVSPAIAQTAKPDIEATVALLGKAIETRLEAARQRVDSEHSEGGG